MSMPIRFLVDEDFDNDILRGVLRRKPNLDIVRVQDVGLGEWQTRKSWNGRRKRDASC
jgi:hypothetical protein